MEIEQGGKRKRKRKRKRRPPGFVSLKVAQFQTLAKPSAEAFCEDFHRHYKALYDASRVVRKLPHLSCVQTSLSEFKRRLCDANLATPEFLAGLRLSAEDMRILKKAKARNAHKGAIDLPSIDADQMVLDCRKLLTDPSPYLRLLALACLTGRRTAELLFCMSFNPPLQKHHTHSKFWSNVTGICKQRRDDEDPLISREVPLLVERTAVNACLAGVRRDLPVGSIKEVNRRYGKRISRTMRKHAPVIGNIHSFRRFYALTAFEFFNERHCSLARLSADYLCHKTMSSTVLTYLSFRIKTGGRLDFS